MSTTVSVTPGPVLGIEDAALHTEAASKLASLCQFVDSVEQQQYDLRRYLGKMADLVADVESDSWDTETLEELRTSLVLKASLQQKELRAEVEELKAQLAEREKLIVQQEQQIRQLSVTCDTSREEASHLASRLQLAETAVRQQRGALSASGSSSSLGSGLGAVVDASPSTIVPAVVSAVSANLDTRHAALLAQVEDRLSAVQSMMEAKLDAFASSTSSVAAQVPSTGSLDAAAGAGSGSGRASDPPPRLPAALWMHSFAVAVVAAAVSVFLPSYLQRSGLL